MTKYQTCEYILDRFPQRECGRPVERGDRCIFHIPKRRDADSTNSEEVLRLDRELRQRFQEEFSKLLHQLDDNNDIESYDFRGFQFPLLQGRPFRNRTFKKFVDFTSATFEWAYFHDCHFEEKVSFRHCNFSNHTYFTLCVFNKDAMFSETVFEGWVEFNHSAFAESVEFQSAAFLERASFNGARFGSGSVDFDMARFEKSASFWRIECEGPAKFEWVKFGESVGFANAVFKDKVNFEWSEFQSANFQDTVFLKEVSFSRCTINGSFRIIGLKEACFRNRVNLQSLVMLGNAEVSLDGLELVETTFLDTNLERVNFRNVLWSRHRSFWKNWAALWDEVRPLSEGEVERDYEGLAENYRQLVLNCERKRDYELAEDFHIGEMEMRRKKKGALLIKGFLVERPKWWRQTRERLNTYTVYQISSNYGTSYMRALLMLIALLLCFSLAFLYSGFRITENGTTRVVEYNLLSNSDHRPVSLKQWIRDYVAAISLSTSILTFQKERFEPATQVAQFWLYIASVVLTGQSAMILLALRRRFRR